MSVYHRSTAKSRILQEYRNREEEISTALSRQITNKTGLETEKRMRREIANSNERRRMQSINAGFQHLRALLPHTVGEKLSKAAILQQTTEYIRGLHQDKVKLQAQNTYYRRLLSEVSRRCNIDLEMDISLQDGSPPLKRKKRDTESSDEGIAADFEDLKSEEVWREVMELRQALEKERQLRMILEVRARTMESQNYEEKVKPLTNHLDALKVKSLPALKEKPIIEETKLEENTPPLVHLSDHEMERPVTKASPPHRPEPQDTPSSMSRRNLETIVEAIRHLEGESIKTETSYMCAVSQSQQEALRPQFYIQRSEESESCSEHDDLRSQSSERDSPSVHHHHNYVRLQNAHNLQRVSLSTKNSPPSVVVSSSSSSNYSDKYPAVTNVLQGGSSSQLQMYYRPGVIVQKS